MASHIRRERRHEKANVSGLVILAIFLMIVAALTATVIGGLRMVESWLQDLPDYTDADSYLNAEPTKILDADGNLIASLYLQNRETVTINDVAPAVLKATVDTEDIRFYQHNGVDPQGIARAAVNTLIGSGREGASTITQQLVRNTVLSDEQFEITLRRKVREAYIAIELEKQYSKDEILMMYLNTIYYGSGAYGIQAASQTYFGKNAKDLSLAESALLAGIPQSPSKLDPTNNMDLALQRRDTVLRRMRDAGDISDQQYQEATKEEIKLNYNPPTKNGTYKYPYFVDYVKSILLDEFNQDVLFKSGLTVKTTIKPELQQYAEESIKGVIGDAEKLEGALISVDVNNGHIVSMVGGKNYENDQFNLATQAKRQPGSAFKVFTLVAAIQEGMSPETMVNANSPAQISENWTVQNYANESAGIITLREATWRSLNTAYARVSHEIGAGATVETAKAMGITSPLQQVESVSLGVFGTSPLELASSFATLASGGIHRDPVAITEVVDRKGQVIFSQEDTSKRVIDEDVAAATNDVLKGVVTNGTAKYANPNDNHIYAGKTGTSQNVRDLWMIGYTTSYSTAVWVGYRQEAEIRFNGALGTTGKLPSPIFKAYMTKAMKGLPRQDFPTAPEPEYKNSSEWDLGAQAQESTQTSSSAQESSIAIGELSQKYPGYGIATVSVFDPVVPAGSVVKADVNHDTHEILVYISKGKEGGETLEDLFTSDDLNNIYGNQHRRQQQQPQQQPGYQQDSGGGFYDEYQPSNGRQDSDSGGGFFAPYGY